MKPGMITPLGVDLQPLIQEFNRCFSHARLLAIVSPT
jgi:hypothetical protein